MRTTLRRSFILMALSLLLSCLTPGPQAGCATGPFIASDLQQLQGHWEGEGPSGKISITITGNSLHFYARPDFWYETIFTLPPGTYPKQLHATIKDSAPPKNDLGQVVVAIFKIESGTLTLAVNDGSTEPPATFAEALSHYHLKMAQPPEKRAEGSALSELTEGHRRAPEQGQWRRAAVAAVTHRQSVKRRHGREARARGL